MKKVLFIAFMFMISLSQAFGQGDANYKATLKKMLGAAGSEGSFKVAIKQMFEMFKQERKDVPDSIWADFEQEFAKASMDDLTEMLFPVYKKYMTENDLNQIIEFYQTPVGKKFAEKTPMITQESMQVGQQWGMQVGKKFQEKLKEKGY